MILLFKSSFLKLAVISPLFSKSIIVSKPFPGHSIYYKSDAPYQFNSHLKNFDSMYLFISLISQLVLKAIGSTSMIKPLYMIFINIVLWFICSINIFKDCLAKIKIYFNISFSYSYSINIF